MKVRSPASALAVYDDLPVYFGGFVVYFVDVMAVILSDSLPVSLNLLVTSSNTGRSFVAMHPL